MRIVLGTLLGVALALPGCRRIEEAPPLPRGPSPVATPPEVEPPPEGRESHTVVVPDFGHVAAAVSPAVVTVTFAVPGRATSPNKVVRGLGSGMVVSNRGQILTNAHVTAEAQNIFVELSTRDRVPARVVFADPMLDLALLELESVPEGLVPVTFAQTEPRPGEWVMAVGQPMGLGHTVTVGVVSGLGRDHRDIGRPPQLDKNGIWSFIQTDASINVGNSGGPLVNTDGEVVGITTAVRSDGQGLAFAIPAPMARRFLEEVWTYGRVRHARLGIAAENAYGALEGRGSVVRITKVEEPGPGADASLLVGDLLLAIDDHPITRVSEVAYLTQLAGVGSRVTVTIKRGERAPEQIVLVPSAR